MCLLADEQEFIWTGYQQTSSSVTNNTTQLILQWKGDKRCGGHGWLEDHTQFLLRRYKQIKANMKDFLQWDKYIRRGLN